MFNPVLSQPGKERRHFGENISPHSYDLSRPEVTKITGFAAKRQGRLLRSERDINAQQLSVLPDDVSQDTHVRAAGDRTLVPLLTFTSRIFNRKGKVNSPSIIKYYAK